MEHLVQSNEYRELYDLTGHQVPFDWRIFPGGTTTTILREIKRMTAKKGTSLAELQGN